MKGSTVTFKIVLTVFLTVLTIFLTGLFILFLLPRLTKYISTWGNNELLTFVTFLGVVIAVTVPFISHWLSIKRDKSHESTVYVIDIGVKLLDDNFVLFSASIQNVGDKQITTSTANLYIDQGLKHDLANDRDSSSMGVSIYQFPFILEHKEFINNRPDCVLCKKCFRDKDPSYPEESVLPAMKADHSLFRAHYELDHLSSKSIMYINPKEKFSEDVIVQFKKRGVYRVTLFVGAKDTADCCCATKQFYIPKSLSEEQMKQEGEDEI